MAKLVSNAATCDAAGQLDAVPPTGSEGAIQTTNSLPRGFSDNTVAYAQARSVGRFFAERGEHVRLATPRLADAHRG